MAMLNNDISKENRYTYSFKIDYPESKAGRTSWNANYSLNAYYAGKHWSVRKADAQYWHALVCDAIGREKVQPKICPAPVFISFFFNDNLDCSNHAAMAKMIEDAIKGIIIQDDSPKYVRGIFIGFHDKPYIQIDVKQCKDA